MTLQGDRTRTTERDIARVLARLWLRPSGYETPNSPHLVRDLGRSIETLCSGRWSATEPMEAFVAVETAGVLELVGAPGVEPCSACLRIARERRVDAGLRKLRDVWATTFSYDGEGG